MAGFFGMFDYTKEGPGVNKDEPPKARILVFFEVLGRKFWNLVNLNLMFFIFNIPSLIIGLVLSGMLVQIVLPVDVLKQISDQGFNILFGLGFPMVTIFLLIPIITVGPAQAGFTYVLRNHSREEHAFLWGDFKEHALKNFKQSSIISLINLVVFVVLVVDASFYVKFLQNIGQGTADAGMYKWFIPAASGFLIVGSLLVMMMNMFIYPMLITFHISIKQLLKNALIFSIVKFLPNLIILVLCFAFTLVL